MGKTDWEKEYDPEEAETTWRAVIPREGSADLHLEVSLLDRQPAYYARAWSTEPGNDTWFVYPRFPISSSRAFKPVNFASLEGAQAWCGRLIKDISGVIPAEFWADTIAPTREVT